MRDGSIRRWLHAIFFALLAGLVVAFANPVDRLKADVRADAKGFVLSLEYSAKLISSPSQAAPVRRMIVSISQ